MNYFAKPGVAIGFGAFMLCAETCLHAESFLAADATAFELPIHDWAVGIVLVLIVIALCGLVSTLRSDASPDVQS
jgi:heme/copper-type cytochrome/quinol oxidase subunit 1